MSIPASTAFSEPHGRQQVQAPEKNIVAQLLVLTALFRIMLTMELTDVN